ncbi:MAG TPA: ABC transporter permease [Actinomycetota bacterium]
MSSVGLAARLAGRNLRRRPGQAVLLLLALTIATGTLGLGLSVYGSADDAWDRAWRATRGFSVSFNVYHPPDESGNDAFVRDMRRRAVELAEAPGVVAVGGPWTHLYGSIEVAGGNEDLTAEIREPGSYPVDQPLVTSGRWLGPEDGVVLEGGLASTVGAGPGDTVTIQGAAFPVLGVATTVSRGRFPLARPAQVWVTPRTAGLMRDLGMTEEGFELQLRLGEPSEAPAFVARHGPAFRSDADSSAIAFLETWEQRRAQSHSDIDIVAGTLLASGTLIAILTIATAAVLVAGRMAARTRQVGTLKAVGVTPWQVVLSLLLEYGVVALTAVVAGLGIGWLLAPVVADASVTLLGSPEPRITWIQVAIVSGVALLVVLVGTVRPAFRGIRRSTVSSLTRGARPPKRPGRLARWAAGIGLPVPGVLGLRSAWRRPGRLATNAAGLTFGVAMIVVALALRDSLEVLNTVSSEPGHASSDAAVAVLYEQIRAIVLATAALLVALGSINAFIVAAFAARDGARSHAAVRAVGGTPRQTVIALIVSQLGACAIAVAVGIPLGLGLWSLMEGGDLPEADVSASALLLVAAVVPLVFAAVVSLPARRLANRPIAPLLTYE